MPGQKPKSKRPEGPTLPMKTRPRHGNGQYKSVVDDMFEGEKHDYSGSHRYKLVPLTEYEVIINQNRELRRNNLLQREEIERLKRVVHEAIS